MSTISPMLMRDDSAARVSVRDTERLDAGRSFQAVLSRAESTHETAEQTADRAARQLVAVALVQPIFERLRSSNQASAPFGPGQAEKTFGPILDAELSQRLTAKSNWPLVTEVARRLNSKLQSGEETSA